jgi:hypothetical protein
MTDATSHRMAAGGLGASSAAADFVSPPATIAGRSRALPVKLRRLLKGSALSLLLGAAVAIAVAIALGLFVDVSLGKTETADSWTGRYQWTVTRWDRIGATCIQSVREGAANWSPGQAIGPPNTPATGGDQVTAWASATTDAQEEWLLLEYAEPIIHRAVRIYETCSTGAVALLRPVWPGFLVNSVFFAVVLAALYRALTVPRRFVREVGRLRRGRCVACGYDLGFDFAAGCPECGWRRGTVAGRPAL